MKKVTKPDGLFRGRNFMTPDAIAYYQLYKGYAELSEGTGMSRQTIYGVTVQGYGETLDGIPDSASRMFRSKSEALSYIKALSDSGE
jgi:hypothetical protein